MSETSALGCASRNADRRDEFLFHLYDQAYGNINRQFGFVWQSAGLVAAALAVFAFARQERLPRDIPATLFILVAGWYAANLIDANHWFNRNLHIIANIERAFLRRTDVHDIHFYFRDRHGNKFLMHLKIQFALVASLTLLVSIYYSTQRSVAIETHWVFSPAMWLAFVVIAIVLVWRHAAASQQKLQSESPGVDTLDA